MWTSNVSHGNYPWNIRQRYDLFPFTTDRVFADYGRGNQAEKVQWLVERCGHGAQSGLSKIEAWGKGSFLNRPPKNGHCEKGTPDVE